MVPTYSSATHCRADGDLGDAHFDALLMTRTRPRTPLELRQAIKKLSEDERIVRPGVWYQSQKQHWLR